MLEGINAYRKYEINFMPVKQAAHYLTKTSTPDTNGSNPILIT